MKAMQSMILGESSKDEPAIPPSSIREEIKTVEQPPNDADLIPNEQTQNEKSQSTTQSNTEQQPPKQASSLTNVIDVMYKSHTPTEGGLAKEREREKSRQVILAIANDVFAISNLYFTGKRAKNIEQTPMSAANAKRYQDMLDGRKKMRDKQADVRLMAYGRNHGFNYRKDRGGANWKRSGEWHDNQVKEEDGRYKDIKGRSKVPDEFNIADRDKSHELHKKTQENQEKAQKYGAQCEMWHE